jgi:hypothetical protein
MPIIHHAPGERNIPRWAMQRGFRMFSEWAYATLGPFDGYWSDDVTCEQKGPGEMADYISYLLRLWREKDGQAIWWRASVQDPHSGERVGFAHLDDLVAFLLEQTGPAPPAEDLVEGECTPKIGSTSEEGGSE